MINILENSAPLKDIQMQNLLIFSSPYFLCYFSGLWLYCTVSPHSVWPFLDSRFTKSTRKRAHICSHVLFPSSWTPHGRYVSMEELKLNTDDCQHSYLDVIRNILEANSINNAHVVMKDLWMPQTEHCAVTTLMWHCVCLFEFHPVNECSRPVGNPRVFYFKTMKWRWFFGRCPEVFVADSYST